MEINNIFGKMKIVMLTLILLVFIPTFINGIQITAPASGEEFKPDINEFNVSITIKNEYFGANYNFTDVNFTVSVTPENNGLNLDNSVYLIGDLNAFSGSNFVTTVDTEVSFNFSTIEENKSFEVLIEAFGININTSIIETDSLTFNITYEVDGIFDIVAQSQDVTTQALDEFIIFANVSNQGNADKLKSFNVTFEYDNDLFEFINSSYGNLNVIDLGSNKSKVYYTISRLNSSENQLINFTFNSTQDKGYNYNEDFKLIVYDNILYPQVTVTPVPIHKANITEIYNSSTGIINILTNTLSVDIPVKVRNIGNSLLDILSVVALINNSNLGSGSVNDLVVGDYYEPIYTYEFAAQGLYNVTVNVSGSENISDFDSQLLNITFNFNDTDGDGYFALINGGLDCNNNNDSIYPGAPEICGDGIDQDCNGVDKICSSSGGGGRSSSKGDDDDEEEIVEIQEVEIVVEENKPIIETITKNIEIKFELPKTKEIHTLTLKQITDGFVALEIRSEPINVILATGESADIDVDRDGFKDITVTVNRILSSVRASITIEEFVNIEEEVIESETSLNESQIIQNVTIGVNLPDEELNITAEKDPVFTEFISKRSILEIVILLILIGFIVLIGVGIVYRLSKK